MFEYTILLKIKAFNLHICVCYIGVCFSSSGSRSSVHEALDIIRRKFPPSQFPTVTLIQTNMISSHGVPLPESLQVYFS